MNTTMEKKTKHTTLDRLYTGEGGIDFIGKSKLWYWITGVLVVLSFLSVILRGFTLSIDFEGGTKTFMPAADLSVEEVDETFTDATGVKPEIVQIVGSGDSRTLEINSEKLSDEQIDAARVALYEQYQPLDSRGNPSPDAIGASTVSESWGSTITKRMVIATVVFLVIAAIYIAIRLEREMAVSAMVALLVDGVIIAGIYAATGFQVSPATVIGFLTVLTFSIYDTVIVFDKVRENTEDFELSTRRTYAEQANLAVNQTFMRSISTTVISALPIIAMLVVAVWLMGVGTLKDLAIIQLIGVIEGAFSSVFLATPLLVSLKNRTKKVRQHTAEVLALRSGTTPENSAHEEARTIRSTSAGEVPDRSRTTWRPGRT